MTEHFMIDGYYWNGFGCGYPFLIFSFPSQHVAVGCYLASLYLSLVPLIPPSDGILCCILRAWLWENCVISFHPICSFF